MPFIREFRKAIFRMPGVRKVVLDLEDRLWLREHHRRHGELHWQLGPRSPRVFFEPARIQIGPKLYVFGGYTALSRVSQRIEMFDLETRCWRFLGNLPEGAPQSHQGITHDGCGHVFLVGGQVGPHCAPATAECFVYKLTDHSWHSLPRLPEVRYLPIVHYYNGRIHCMTGNLNDRKSNAYEHWSIAVENGVAIEPHWRCEGRFPYARMHVASELVGAEVIVMAGQEGDVPRMAGEIFCDFNTPKDVMHDDVFAYHLETRQVRQLASMPEAISHTDCSSSRVGDKIIVSGGLLERQVMARRIYVYDLIQDRWDMLGCLPHAVKASVTACWNGTLYQIAGQRSISDSDLRPGSIVDSVFFTELPQFATQAG